MGTTDKKRDEPKDVGLKRGDVGARSEAERRSGVSYSGKWLLREPPPTVASPSLPSFSGFTLQSQQSTTHQGNAAIFFALLHAFVFSFSLSWWKWWGITLGFFINCALDAIILIAWCHKSNRNIRDGSSDYAPFS